MIPEPNFPTTMLVDSLLQKAELQEEVNLITVTDLNRLETWPVFVALLPNLLSDSNERSTRLLL